LSSEVLVVVQGITFELDNSDKVLTLRDFLE